MIISNHTMWWNVPRCNVSSFILFPDKSLSHKMLWWSEDMTNDGETCLFTRFDEVLFYALVETWWDFEVNEHSGSHCICRFSSACRRCIAVTWCCTEAFVKVSRPCAVCWIGMNPNYENWKVITHWSTMKLNVIVFFSGVAVIHFHT